MKISNDVMKNSNDAKQFHLDMLGRYGLISVYKQMIVTLVLLVLVSVPSAGIGILASAATAVASAVLFHHSICRIRKEKHVSYDSVVISGLFIGLILAPNNLFAIIIASFAAVASKSIKSNGRHVFNPAMAGIFAATVLTPSFDSWAGASQVVPVLILGSLVAQKFRRLHLVIPFVVTYLSLSAAYRFASSLQPIYIEALGGILYFFAFLMLIEPRTTPATKNARTVYGIASAAIVFVLALIVPQYAMTGGLLLSNLFVQPIEKIINNGKAKTTSI